MKKNSLLLVIMFWGIIATGLVSCSKDSDSTGTPQTNIVTIQSMSFTPSTITVAKGTTITWKNNDGNNHTVTSDDGTSFNEAVNAGTSVPKTFNTAGTFPYHCSIHSSMTATVIVTP